MVIQHNLCALNAARQFGLINATKSKTTEKLASGYRINRAADDAAGLAISEKMRRQIRGLTQASRNAQDGISMLQTAEGAINEVHDMLHRMNELCVQASNGTLMSEDREYIQYEISELIDEIDRIGNTSTFNEIKLLKGLPPNAVAAVAPNITGIGGSITSATGNSPAYYDIAPLESGDIVGIGNSSGTYTYYCVDGIPEEDGVYDGKSAATAYNAGAATVYSKIASALIRANSDDPDVEQVATNYTTTGENAGRFSIEFYGPLHVKLQVGCEAEDEMDVVIDEVNAGSLGVRDIDVRTQEGAVTGIEQVKRGIETLSGQRAKLGAMQNRLDHKIKNLDNVIENTTTAESRIRDGDIASLMVSFSNSNILAQAGNAILSQANKQNDGILSLLT